MRKELRTNILIFALWICLAIVIHFGLTCAIVHPIGIDIPVTMVEQSDASVEAYIVKAPSKKTQTRSAEASPRETPKILESATSPALEQASKEAKTDAQKNTQAEAEPKRKELPPEQTVPIKNSNEPPQTEDILTQADQKIPDALETEGSFTAEAEGTLIPVPPAATKSPAPRYPSQAKKEGRSGTTYLRVTVDESGKPIRVRIEASSGHKDLDERARDTVQKRWRFASARETSRRGEPKVTFVIDIQFRMDNPSIYSG